MGGGGGGGGGWGGRAKRIPAPIMHTLSFASARLLHGSCPGIRHFLMDTARARYIPQNVLVISNNTLHILNRVLYDATSRPDAQDRVVSIKDVLRSVAVVYVKVEDHDSFEAMVRLDMAGDDCYIVKDAKPHGPLPTVFPPPLLTITITTTISSDTSHLGNSVVAGRPRNAKAGGLSLRLRPKDLIGNRYCQTRRLTCHLVCISGSVRRPRALDVDYFPGLHVGHDLLQPTYIALVVR